MLVLPRNHEHDLMQFLWSSHSWEIWNKNLQHKCLFCKHFPYPTKLRRDLGFIWIGEFVAGCGVERSCGERAITQPHASLSARPSSYHILILITQPQASLSARPSSYHILILIRQPHASLSARPSSYHILIQTETALILPRSSHFVTLLAYTHVD